MSTNASQPEVFDMEIETTRIPRTLLIACLVSFGVHVLGLGVLGVIKFAQNINSVASVSTVVDHEGDDSFQPRFDSTVSDQIGTEGDITTFSASQEASSALSKDTQTEIEKSVNSSVVVSVSAPTTDELPRPSKTDVLASVATSGTTEHAGGVNGAIDRLSWEIANSLREKKTLVVWLFDVSPSLSGRRAQIADRVENVYNQLTQLNVGADKALRSAVAVFGEKCTIVTDKPLDDAADLVKTVRKIKSESSGTENTFAAVNLAANKFKSQSDRDHRVMMIVVTDEAGSDPVNLEQAIVTCRKYQIRCYCVGDSAPFGRETVESQFEMENGETVIGVMQKGPESFYPELVRLGFWGTHSYDLDDMSSGFGPYALTRLCSETNGLYFIADNGRGQHQFDAAVMRNYSPDYRPIPTLENDLRHNKAKSSLVQACAALVSETQRRKVLSISMPRLDFKADNDTVLRQELTEAQKPIADLDLSLDSLLRLLEQGEKDRVKIKEARWKASYDLAMGRTLALRVRAFGYNTMLAEMKANPKKFETAGNNQWRLVPANEITSGATTKKMASKAKEYLSHVIDDHPRTPWELLAKRELGVPLGWEWKESHYDANPPMAAGNQKAQGPKIIETIDPVTKKKVKKQVNTDPPQRRDI